MSVPGLRVETGFTLLELLVVVALLGMVVWLGAITASDWRNNPGKVRAGLTKILLDARLKSAVTGAVVSVDCLQLRKRLGELSGATDEALPHFSCGSLLGSTDGKGLIRFYPDGSSSAGYLQVDAGQRLTVDWFTSELEWQ